MRGVIAAILGVTVMAGVEAGAQGQENGAGELAAPPLITEAGSLEPFLWVARPVVVFADTPNDPRYIQQIELLEARRTELEARDVVVVADTDPEADTDLRRKLRPRGFMLVLIGKDGQVKLRKPAPWDVRELTRVIDKMPLRRQEVRDAQRRGEG